MADYSEIILAQEESVLYKTGVGKETQGTLVLTDRKLLFVAAKEEAELTGGFAEIRYTNVEDLSRVPSDPSNFEISLSAISNVKGSSGVLSNPKLKVTWDENGKQKTAEFIQTITGIRKKNLNDWAHVIEDIKNGKMKVEVTKSPPSIATLEGKVLYVLGDMQSKGPLALEEEVEEEFKIDLDPDKVEEACENLVTQGLVAEETDGSGEKFYTKKSPLGNDDLTP